MAYTWKTRPIEYGPRLDGLWNQWELLSATLWDERLREDVYHGYPDELVWVVTDVTTEPGKRVKELGRFWFREAVKPH